MTDNNLTLQQIIVKKTLTNLRITHAGLVELGNLGSALNKQGGYLTCSPQSVSDCFVFCTIIISFSRSNTHVSALTSDGRILTSKSAGSVGFVGKKQKTRRTSVLHKLVLAAQKDLNQIFLESPNLPISLLLKNVSTNKKWVVKLVKKFFVINSVKTFDNRPYNGCRPKKMKRSRRTRLIKR